MWFPTNSESKRSGVLKKISPKKCKSKNSGSNKFLVQKVIGPKKFVSNKILVPKNIRPPKNWVLAHKEIANKALKKATVVAKQDFDVQNV